MAQYNLSVLLGRWYGAHVLKRGSQGMVRDDFCDAAKDAKFRGEAEAKLKELDKMAQLVPDGDYPKRDFVGSVQREFLHEMLRDKQSGDKHGVGVAGD